MLDRTRIFDPLRVVAVKPHGWSCSGCCKHPISCYLPLMHNRLCLSRQETLSRLGDKCSVETRKSHLQSHNHYSRRDNVWRTWKQVGQRAPLDTKRWLKLSPKQVQHAKRTQSLAHLPPYQTEIVRAVTREVRDLDKDVTAILEPFGGNFDPSTEPATACALLVDHLCMRRNKRCLLAYRRVRVDKLEEMCWKGSDVLENAQQEGGNANGTESANITSLVVDTGNVSSLSPEEEEYVRQFSDLLAAYKGKWTDIDLTGSLEPPRDLFIDVRVLKDAGEIQTEYG